MVNPLRFGLIAILGLGLALPVAAQGWGQKKPGWGAQPPGWGRQPEAPSATGRVWRDDPREAQRIAGWVDDAWGLCRTLPAAYQTDCLAGEYRAIAARIPDDSPFARQTKAALAAAVQGLDAASAPARDTSQPRIRAKVPARRGVPDRTTVPITPVRAEAAARVNARAADAITAAGALLLRSVPDDDPRAASFRRIAAAFGNTAVLIRS